MFVNFDATADADLGIWAQTQVDEYEDSTKFNSTLSNAQGSSSAPLLKTLGDASDIASDFVVIVWPLGERLVLLYIPTFNAPSTWDLMQDDRESALNMNVVFKLLYQVL